MSVVVGAVVSWSDRESGQQIGVVVRVEKNEIVVNFDRLSGERRFARAAGALRRVPFSNVVAVTGVEKLGRPLRLVRDDPPIWEVSFGGEVKRYPEAKLRNAAPQGQRERVKSAGRKALKHTSTTLRDIASFRERGNASREKNERNDAAVNVLRTEYQSRVANRPAIEKRINDERCGGDPAESEGSRLALKDRLDNEARIDELGEMISEATGTRPTFVFRSSVRIGAVVSVHFDGDRTDTGKYAIGSSSFDSKIDHCKPESPLGQAIMGRRPGETVDYKTDRGIRISVTIDKVVV